ncbi:MAG: hypothetical protein GY928_33015 [Colwellia sp.]|nr:hypothetical protein [Colwellia sp.]
MSLYAERAKTLASEGLYSKAVKALTSNTISTMNKKTLETLKQLHPYRPNPTISSNEAP